MSYNPAQITEEAKKNAAKFFEHARTVAETRNYDYAIELYIQGLSKDPQAVETGHKPLRDIALKRALSGAKKAGLFESLKKNSSIQKDSYQSLLNAEYLFSKDPLNGINHCETMVKSMDKAEIPDALFWGLQVFFDLTRQEKKLNANRLLLIKDLFEKLGDYYDKQDKPDLATKCYQGGLNALDIGIMGKVGQNMDFVGIQRDLAGKLTIFRGKYERADGFRESIKDAGAQQEIQDQGRTVKSEDMLEQMIIKGRRELESNPNVAGKINSLCDLLLQRGKPEDEAEAIATLEKSFEKTRQYGFKLRADDIRIRQMTRIARELKTKFDASKDPQIQTQFEEAQKTLDQFELKTFSERVSEYPTDIKIKFEYGKRLLKVKQFDDAIPIFQETLSDPRHSIRAKYFIGTCFYHKGWTQQAIDILSEAIREYTIPGDNLNKEMHYMLGRSYENAGQKDQALKTYNRLIQWDFNYRDARVHIDKLQKQN